MPNKNLTVNISGDTKGLESALLRAEGQLGGFEREIKTTRASVTALEREVAKGSRSIAAAEAAQAKAVREQEAAQAKVQKSASHVGSLLAGIGAAGVLGFALAVKATADFDKHMSAVKANTNAAGKSMDALREAALKAGQTTAYSASESADAENELAKAGVSVKDILGGGLKGALSLASAGQLDVGKSAEIAATAMVQFHLSGQQIPHLADLLAAGADKAQGSVEDLGEALNYGGLVASQTGLSIEQTVGTLTSFAAAGLQGSVAGTTLKQMLLKLEAPSKEASGLMAQYGINMYNARGQFVGITALAGELHDKLAKLTPAQRNSALAVIFGSRAIQGANVLYKQGATGLQNWINKVNDQGFAAKQASTKMDNLAGDWKKFKGALDAALIGGGSGANGFLRDLTKGATAAVRAFDDLPPSVQGGATALAGVGGAALLAVGGMLIMIPKIAETRKALVELREAGVLTNASLGSIGKKALIGLGVLAGVAAVTVAMDEASIHARGMSDSINDVSAAEKTLGRTGQTVGAVTDQFGKNFQHADMVTGSFAGNVKRLADPSWSEKIENGIGRGLSGVGLHLDTAAEKFKKMDAGLAQLVQGGDSKDAAAAFQQIAAQARKAGVSTDQLKKLFPQYTAAVNAAKKPTDAATSALQREKTAGEDVAMSVKDMISAWKQAVKPEIDASNAAITLANDHDDLASALKKSRGQIGLHTAAQRSSFSAWNTYISDTEDLAQKTHALTGRTSTYTSAVAKNIVTAYKAAGTNKTLHKTLTSVWESMGLSATAAHKLDTTIQGDIKRGASFHEILGDIKKALAAIPSHKKVTVDATGNWSVERGTGGHGSGHYASGGAISGAGTGTSDDIPIMASNGEYMVRSAAHQQYGTQAMDAVNSGRAVIGYASGGSIGQLPSEITRGVDTMTGDIAKALVKEMMASAGAGIGGSGVQRWAPLVLQVLGMLGQSASWLGTVLARMNQESGGNPNAINRWDSNAKAGHPSQGLMQTIPGTFSAYAGPFRSLGILNPLANIYAGLNYAIHRYGSLGALSRPGGYAAGTAGAAPGWAWVGEAGPELVRMNGGEQVVPHGQSVGAMVSHGYASGTDAIKHVGKKITIPNEVRKVGTVPGTNQPIYLGDAAGLAQMKKYGEQIVKTITLGMSSSLSQVNAEAKTLLADAAKYFTGSKEAQLKKWITSETNALEGIASKRDAINAQITAANSYNTDEVSSLGDYINLASFGGGASTSQIAQGLTSGLARIKTFSSLITQLQKAGASKAVIQQIVAMGPDQGSEFARSLLAGGKGGISKINSLTSQITAAEKATAATATDILYDSGKQAGKGFLSGLEAQKDALDKQMDKLGAQIASGLSKAFHKGATNAYITIGGDVGGYASGTNSATRGWHLVGESGPELAYFRGGERVMSNRVASRTPVRGGDGASAPTVINNSAVINHVPGYSTPADLRNAQAQLNRQSRLARAR